MPDSLTQSAEDLVSALPDSLQDNARNWLDQLSDQYPDALSSFVRSGGDLQALVHMIACSVFAGIIIARHWHWLCECSASDQLDQPVDSETLQSCFRTLSHESNGSDDFKSRLRIQRNQMLVRILWRDLVHECSLTETLGVLTLLAESALNAATEFAGAQLLERFGSIPLGPAAMPIVVLAMGKLGGRELNFSSDIDIIFLYPGEGESDGPRSLSAHEYFTRYSREVVSLLEDATNDGFVYRVDTRLRPFGDSGPPVVSFAALEAYLLQHGRDWERYAYVKARIVVPAADHSLSTDLLDEVIRPFVYRRYLDYGVFESLRDMHALVATEVRKREMEGNIKLGPGGIREIEFIVQSLQLVRGGSVAGLRVTGLREALESAVIAHDIGRETASKLLAAYEFFRHIENRIQAVRDQQVHELPTSKPGRDRLVLAMGYSSWQELSAKLNTCREYVGEKFAAISKRTGDVPNSDSSTRLAGLWGANAAADIWRDAFERVGMEEPPAVAEVIVSFAAVAAKKQLDSVSATRLHKLVPAVLLILAGRQRPAATLNRLLNIADKVLRRSAYVALLNENPTALLRLVDLCEESIYLAEEIGRFPQLLDELLDHRLYKYAANAAEMNADLEQRLASVADDDSEQRIEVVARFQRATLFRLAVADLGGNIPIMKISDRLTDLAEIVLCQSLAVACDDLVARYGEPQYELAGQRHTAGFGIIAYGKLGGMELSYGSDLDLVFLHDSTGERQQTSGEKSIMNSDFFARLARRLVHFLTTQTGSGILYDIDTRLRPSGQSGLLVTSIEAFERYQEENAWTWEHQALLRSRPVAGSQIIAREFDGLRLKTLRQRVRRDQLAGEVSSMRGKMRAQLDRSDDKQFDLKQGRGGIGDIEFLVQYWVLANAAEHPAVLHYADNIRQLGTLVAAGCVSEAKGRQLQEIYQNYRLLLHRLALDRQPSLIDPDTFREQRLIVAALWDNTFDVA